MAQRRRALMTGVRSVTRIVAIAAAQMLLMLLPASAQYISGMRGPNMVTVGPRMPNINPGVTLRPSVHYSPNVTVDGAAASPPHLKSGNDDTPGSGSGRRGKKKPGPNLSGDTFVAREVVTDGVVSDEQAAAIARRHRITRLESFSLPLVGSTLTRWRITDARSVGAVVRELVADNTIKSVQPNFRFMLQDGPGASEGDPAQYALAKLHFPEAHVLTRGEDVTIAVIDSGIDYGHPEFAGSISATFDVLASKEGAHPHGTGIAGVIVSHARLMGGAPAAKILAIRAFGVADKTVESTSFAILRSLDFAIARGARVVNMSFAGPQDPLLAKGLAAAAAKGIVLVAASGNAGPKSPPLFPAADRHVVAVSAVDATNEIFLDARSLRLLGPRPLRPGRAGPRDRVVPPLHPRSEGTRPRASSSSAAHTSPAAGRATRPAASGRAPLRTRTRRRSGPSSARPPLRSARPRPRLTASRRPSPSPPKTEANL